MNIKMNVEMTSVICMSAYDKFIECEWHTRPFPILSLIIWAVWCPLTAILMMVLHYVALQISKDCRRYYSVFQQNLSLYLLFICKQCTSDTYTFIKNNQLCCIGVLSWRGSEAHNKCILFFIYWYSAMSIQYHEGVNV